MQTSYTCPRCNETKYTSIYNARIKKSPYCKGCATAVRNEDNATHGLERHPLYRMWSNMKRRVGQPVGKDQCYADLDIDPAWLDVVVFYNWALANGWERGLSIERDKLERGYWPDNCRFIPVKHQARNRRGNSVTPAIAKLVQDRVAAGEVRYRVAKDVSSTTGIPLSTVVKVAYGYNW